MEYISGVILALFIAWLAKVFTFDRDRSFYPVILIVIATYYILFAFISMQANIIFIELVVALMFIAIAILGSRVYLLLVVAGLIAHGIFDLIHHLIVTNSMVPSWWPGFYAAIDIVLGVVVYFIAKTRSTNASNQPLNKVV